jgi:hypothetical protein
LPMRRPWTGVGGAAPSRARLQRKPRR